MFVGMMIYKGLDYIDIRKKKKTLTPIIYYRWYSKGYFASKILMIARNKEWNFDVRVRKRFEIFRNTSSTKKKLRKKTN